MKIGTKKLACAVLTVASLAIAATAHSAVVKIEHAAGGGYDPIGEGTVGTTSTATFAVGNYAGYVESAVLSIYLADDDPSQYDEFAAFQYCKANCGNVANWLAMPSNRLMTRQPIQSDGISGNYEVDGKICPAGQTFPDPDCFSYYDRFDFNVLDLVSEGAVFSVKILEGDDDPNDLFWYKGSVLKLTTKVFVPEPATLGLLGMGLMGIGLARRLKRG